MALRKLLGLCDDLHRIRSRLADLDLGSDAEQKLRRQSRRKGAQLAKELASYRFRGPLGLLLRGLNLRAEHFQILAILLQRHMRSDDPALDGRTLLSAVFDSSYDVLAGIEYLHETSPLRVGGLVLVEDAEDAPRDLLQARYRVGEEAIEAFRAESALFVPEDQQRAPASSYVSHRELLIDLRILHNLYKLRSERVFLQDRWDRVHAGPTLTGIDFARRIDAFWKRIRERVAGSASHIVFPAWTLVREYRLEDHELMVVVHLLFSELYDGVAHSEVKDLLRLVSADEDELIRNRRLFVANATLRREALIRLEPWLEGRELTGEVCLEDWVVNTLLGSAPAERTIASDERLDWHRYLEGLGDSGRFFDDLERS